MTPRTGVTCYSRIGGPSCVESLSHAALAMMSMHRQQHGLPGIGVHCLTAGVQAGSPDSCGRSSAPKACVLTAPDGGIVGWAPRAQQRGAVPSPLPLPSALWPLRPHPRDQPSLPEGRLPLRHPRIRLMGRLVAGTGPIYSSSGHRELPGDAPLPACRPRPRMSHVALSLARTQRSQPLHRPPASLKLYDPQTFPPRVVAAMQTVFLACMAAELG